MGSRRWPPWAIKSLEQGLDRLATAVQSNPKRDIDEQIWLTRFLVIRACGYLEQVVHECVTGYLQLRGGGPAQAFSLSWLNKSRNPSPTNLLEIVGRFDESWRHDLDMLLNADGNHLNNELSMLVARRNQIAHGLNEGLGSQKALELVDTAKAVADWFIRQFDPISSSSR
jgi:hypothetical protein